MPGAGAVHPIKMVACPRNHFYRTFEQMVTRGATAAVVLVACSQGDHGGDLANQLDLKTAPSVSHRMQHDALNE